MRWHRLSLMDCYRPVVTVCREQAVHLYYILLESLKYARSGSLGITRGVLMLCSTLSRLTHHRQVFAGAEQIVH
jgi:hypothetical protein